MELHIGLSERRGIALLALAVAVLLALLLANTYLSSQQQAQQTITEVSEVYLRELSGQMVSRFEAGVDARRNQMNTLGGALAFQPPSNEEDLRDFLTEQAESSMSGCIMLVARSRQEVVVASDTPQGAAVVHGGLEQPLAQLEGDASVVLYADMIAITVSTQPFHCGQQVFDELVGYYDTESATSGFKADLFGGAARSSLIARDGTCLACGPDCTIAVGQNVFELLSTRAQFDEGYGALDIQTAFNKGEALIVPVTLEGNHEFLYFTPLFEGQRFLCTVMPYGAVDGDIDAFGALLVRNALLVGATVVAVLCLFFFIYWRMLQRSARLLAEEKVRTEQALTLAEEANVAKSEFLSRMSHEIRTPLNGIIGMVAIALNHTNDEEKVRDSLAKAQSASKHLLNLVNDILDMSKIESGALQAEQKPFDFTELIDSVSSVFEEQAREDHLVFHSQVDEGVPRCLSGDALRLTQVLYNLLGNAFKFTPEGGQVSLVVERICVQGKSPGGTVWVRFQVQDSGCGIAPERLEAVFEVFEQGDAQVSQRFGGTGLGLPIAKRLVEMMGGHIGLESTLGQGSCFSVELPFAVKEELTTQVSDAAVSPSPTIASEQAQKPATSLADAAVLVAEDNDLNREIIVELLADAGVRVTAVENGEEVVERFASSAVGEFAVILMDVQMPCLDGYQAARAIRSLMRPDAETVGIFAMTAHAFAEDVQKSKEAGMNGHLTKPLDIRVVYATIDEFLKEAGHTDTDG